MNTEKTTRCLLCGHTAELTYKNHPGYISSQTFDIYHCKECNTSFSLPQIDASKTYDFIYKNVKLVPGYERYSIYKNSIINEKYPLEFLSDAEDTYWGVKESLSKLNIDRSSSKILEVGSGLGYLTYSLIKEKYDVTGIDISQTAVNEANRFFGNYYMCKDVNEYASETTQKYDIIILTEVIEHIVSPLPFLKSIKKLLNEYGKIILTTPNKSIYPDEVVWDTDLPPVHFWWFSEQSLKYIADVLDLNIKFVNFENYYKDHYADVRIKNAIRQSIVSTDYKINNPKRNNALKKILSKKMPYLKRQYRKIKIALCKNIYICGEKGVTMCAIMTMKDIQKEKHK
ncbi:MAG: type 11 methyltransferase [Bacteroidetes bacterium]|nr:type 11 methyltransferase [Bacteroidota bacterium]